jgi:hypothetical protein
MAGGAVGEEDRRDVLTEGDRALRLRNRGLPLHDEGADEGSETQNHKSLTHH